MKTITKITAALAATVLGAQAAQAATANGTASATVIGPLAVSQTTPMNFGSFSPSATAGTVTSGGITTGGVAVVSAGSNALFTATGNPNSNFSISVPASISMTSGVNSMTNTLTAQTVSALDNTGRRDFNVLGTLAVAANQPSGTYTGSYTVTVNY